MSRHILRPDPRLVCFLLALFTALPVLAQRDPVLKQINHPHSYYYREMYLPQVTTGPSAAAWMPDSRSLVFSMAGSLWQQNLDTTEAQQLTAGAGYDYQPDCSPDGRWVIYASYLKDAVELWVYDRQTKSTRQLTFGGAVNVEPRFSPDGQKVAFVSTLFKGRFHIFTAKFSNGELKNVERLTGENRSSLPRYYYSAYDHEISPAWSRDGSEILFVSNRGHIHGTGGFWRMKAEPGAEAREIHYEETTWRARPEFAPDGKRIVYASYQGRQWHQLWVMPAQGGDVFPISYGEFDNTDPRWSPDGKHIAFISNRGGNTSLWVQEVLGGKQTELVAKQRHYLKPMGRITLKVVDGAGHPTAARVFLTGEDGRAYAPDNAWMHADDSFVRSERAFEPHYFHTAGVAEITVPAGQVTLEVMKGFKYGFEKKTVQVAADQSVSVTVPLRPLNLPREAAHWVSGDVHVHMNYTGAYRATPATLIAQAEAEDLPVIEALIVNKEQRVPDISYFTTKPNPASTANTLLLFGQEYHTSYWGHLGLLNLTDHFLLPGYVGYPNTAAASLFPTNAAVADMAHEQKALVGYVHPYESVPDPAKDSSLNHELPVDLALGKVDYIEVVGFADHKSTAEVWYKLLNLGFHLPTAGGTDAMTNYASLRGPVGLNRVYVNVPPGPLSIQPWLSGLKAGRTFASNGPLLGFTLGGSQIGDELSLPPGENKVKVSAWLRSMVPVEHLQVVCNGQVVSELKLDPGRQSADGEDTISLSRSGWCVLRAYSDQSEYPILDLYPYATTSPIYVKVAGSRVSSPEDAAYFIAWIDRMTEAAKSNAAWNSEAEKDNVLKLLEYARGVYVQREK
ncbi:MAG: CehA/McbA family metallohydrolase [Acidobacteria bacterium]|nr:CehA/McbA family metallohydrolase [Acidobacteriota bacterium]